MGIFSLILNTKTTKGVNCLIEYLSFKDRKEIDKWSLDNHLRLKEQSDIDFAYTYSKWDDFNISIRKERPLTAGEEILDNNLQRMLLKYKTPHNLVVYRGISKEAIKSMIRDAMCLPKHMRHKKNVLERGYLSTSLREEGTLNTEIQLKIYVPVGMPMILIDTHSIEPAQEEILFGKNILMRILSMKKNCIEMQMLGYVTDCSSII